MYQITFTHRMKKDIKLMRKRGKDISKLTVTLSLLASGQPMPDQYNDHALVGNFKGFRECHIEPDWLLLYKIQDDVLILTATATGTHSDIFNK